jgi:hypothetical protein
VQVKSKQDDAGKKKVPPLHGWMSYATVVTLVLASRHINLRPVNGRIVKNVAKHQTNV